MPHLFGVILETLTLLSPRASVEQRETAPDTSREHHKAGRDLHTMHCQTHHVEPFCTTETTQKQGEEADKLAKKPYLVSRPGLQPLLLLPASVTHWRLELQHHAR